jgi:CARDB protein
MNDSRKLWAIGLAGALLAACQPDLAALSPMVVNNTGCQDGVLSLVVRNDGIATQVPTTVSVLFTHKQNPVVVDVPTIGSKASVTVLVPIPKPVPTGQVVFDATVDPNNLIAESDESNNSIRNLSCPTA